MSSHNNKASSPNSSHINLKIKDFNLPTSDLHKMNSRKKLDQSNVSSSMKSVPKPQSKQQKPRPVTAKAEPIQNKPQSRLRENINSIDRVIEENQLVDSSSMSKYTSLLNGTKFSQRPISSQSKNIKQVNMELTDKMQRV